MGQPPEASSPHSPRWSRTLTAQPPATGGALFAPHGGPRSVLESGEVGLARLGRDQSACDEKPADWIGCAGQHWAGGEGPRPNVRWS